MRLKLDTNGHISRSDYLHLEIDMPIKWDTWYRFKSPLLRSANISVFRSIVL
jgi:hypothetical protein